MPFLSRLTETSSNSSGPNNDRSSNDYTNVIYSFFKEQSGILHVFLTLNDWLYSILVKKNFF